MAKTSEVTIPAVYEKPITIDYVLSEIHSFLSLRVMDIIPDDDKLALQTRIDLIQSMIDARAGIV